MAASNRKQSLMVHRDDYGSRCSECGANDSDWDRVELRFRFAKEKIVLCPSCWSELSAQVAEHLRPQGVDVLQAPTT